MVWHVTWNHTPDQVDVMLHWFLTLIFFYFSPFCNSFQAKIRSEHTLNDRNVCCFSHQVEAAIRCAQTTSFVQLHHWRTVYSFNIFKEGNPKSNILQDSMCADFKTGLLNCQILKLCAVSSDVSDRVCQRVCCCKVCLWTFSSSS